MVTWFRRRAGDFTSEARLAEEALNRGDFARASIAYQKIAKQWPDVAFVHTRRGRALLELGRQAEAIGEFNRALELDPREPEALYNRGLVAQDLGHGDEARDFFERAFMAPRPHPEAGLKLAAGELAHGSPAAALKLYQRVLDVDAGIAEAQYGYGEAAMLVGREGDAMAAFARALAIRPEFMTAGGTAIFEGLFRSPPTRQPRTVRPLICLPVVAAYFRNWLGGQSYLVNFVRVMSALPKAQRPRLLVAVHCGEGESFDELRATLDAIAENEIVVAVVTSDERVVVSTAIFERLKRRKNRKDLTPIGALTTSVDWTFPVLYPLWRVPALPGPLFWIPDLQHRFWPSFFSAEEVAGRDRDMHALARRDVPVVFSSESAQKDFLEEFPERKCRTHVWHFVSQPAKVDSSAADHFHALNLPTRFYYTPNQFWRHKDHVTLFQALRRILGDGRDITFVCTGTDLRSANDEYSKELLALIEELSLGRHLRLLGVLSRSDQIEVMRNCCAVIQPSLFEGWSTVIEDARALGRPVIASDIPVHREQLGDTARYFIPRDPASLAEAVLGLDPTLRPGPNPDLEAAALRDLERRTLASGREFFAILAREAELRRNLAEAKLP